MSFSAKKVKLFGKWKMERECLMVQGKSSFLENLEMEIVKGVMASKGGKLYSFLSTICGKHRNELSP